MTVFVDTNVLLHAALARGAEPAKRDRARALLQDEDCVLSLQVLQEFFNQATHPRRRHPLSIEETRAWLTQFRQFPVVEPTMGLFDAGTRVFAGGGFSFWDSMIVAAAIAQGCELLYSEDMQHGRIVAGVRILDPFR